MDADSLVSELHKWGVYTVCKHRVTAQEYWDKPIRVSVLQISLTLTQMENIIILGGKRNGGMT